MENAQDLVFMGDLPGDVSFGFLNGKQASKRQHHPRVVLNADGSTVLRILREEIARCDEFVFSVAFVTPNAIALLKQELVEFEGHGTIVTSDYLGFNSPQAFSELLNLRQLGIDVRIHETKAFHPKGYIFKSKKVVTAMVGSSNLTGNAIVSNHEWNLKVSAADDSDLASQLSALIENQIEGSAPLSQEWVDDYAKSYVAPERRTPVSSPDLEGLAEVLSDALRDPQDILPEVSAITDSVMPILPNSMQSEALRRLELVRQSGESRAIVISATGTGKTILSALEVRAAKPRRFLFIVHREQILDKTIREYQRVIGGPESDFGKLAGTTKQSDRKYVFATVQTLSLTHVLAQFEPDTFDYIIVDEAHRVGSETYRKVLGHLKPGFLLGLTATPERSDGFNVFEFFDYNVPYEIRLGRALEEDMLSPFHYYGIADIELDDCTHLDESADLSRLVTTDRIDHVVNTLSMYGQAGVKTKGLIFCSRKEEARMFSEALNEKSVRGERLRTICLSGDDSIERREDVVAQLERGELDYVLTVDIFNEGVDIPSVNQVVMLRQTKSTIVFVQQLGRGLRKAPRKDYLVVIDFIGNYANNYMIPIALFGDESLNKESLKEKMIASEQAGVLAGLSSVRFDKISQERVLESIRTTPLDSIQSLKSAMRSMRNRVGSVPRLFDFYRFESVDPILLATKKENYPALATSLLKAEYNFSAFESNALFLLSHEVLTAKRPFELILLRELVQYGEISKENLRQQIRDAGFMLSDVQLQSVIDTFTLAEHAQVDQQRYKITLAEVSGDRIGANVEFLKSYQTNIRFADEVDDIIRTGLALVQDRYAGANPFIVGAQYSRKEVARLLGLPRKWTSTFYGYKVVDDPAVCPIFVTLHKSDEVSASTAYQDELIDPSHMRWFTRSRRTLLSGEVKAIVANKVDLHVFVKKDDAEGTEFFYLGQAESRDAVQSTMTGKNGESLDVVHMELHFETGIDAALFDYLSPNEALS